MASNEIRHRARTVTEFADVKDVEANDARLGQVFLNLLVNAAQALPEGSADKNEIRVVTRQSGPDEVVVEVRDTGSGIPPQSLSRIFDPFFTTKAIGVGTGLGLSICHRIILGFQGQIAVESEVGKGTVVRVTLPVAKGVPAVTSTIPVTGPPGRSCRVLFVDDEPVLGPLVRRALAPAHEVTCAASGREALAAIDRGDVFDVILCDLMMPEMSGMDLHEALMQRYPEHAAKMVFMTGGAFTTRARQFLEKVSNPRLDKPFKRDQLRAFVDGLLGLALIHI